MSTSGVPNEAAQKQFVAKLTQFRSSLDADEQRMLDAMVSAVRKAHDQGDVQVYWFTSGLTGVGTQPYGATTDVWSGYPGSGAFPQGPFA
jgi:hypothetical protein